MVGGLSQYRNLLIYAGILLFLGAILVGCSTDESAENTESEETAESTETTEPEEGIDESEEAIRAVIEKEFNGPDEKYRDLWNAMAEKQPADPSEEEYNEFLKSPAYTNLTDYMEKVTRRTLLTMVTITFPELVHSTIVLVIATIE